MKYFSIIVAMDDARGIGKNGGLAWYLPADLKHFKHITTSVSTPGKVNAVVMGRKTWDSLPEKFRPLPGRLNVVLTRQDNFNLPAPAIVFKDFDTALSHLSQDPQVEHIYVIGGAQLYAQVLNHPACNIIHVTHVQGQFDCDASFPPIPANFVPSANNPQLIDSGITYRFIDYLQVKK